MLAEAFIKEKALVVSWGLLPPVTVKLREGFLAALLPPYLQQGTEQEVHPGPLQAHERKLLQLPGLRPQPPGRGPRAGNRQQVDTRY